MSFDVNVLSTKPMIREAASMNNDGGAGNLGYMQQGQKDDEQKKSRLDESIFGKKEKDVFISQKNLQVEDEEFSILKWLKAVIDSIRSVFTSRRNP